MDKLDEKALEAAEMALALRWFYQHRWLGMNDLKLTPMSARVARATDFRDGDFSAPAVRDAIDRFLANGMLRDYVPSDPFKRTYTPTDGMRLWHDELCRVPLPERQWVIPEPVPF